jgi:hypothetical protein
VLIARVAGETAVPGEIEEYVFNLADHPRAPAWIREISFNLS